MLNIFHLAVILFLALNSDYADAEIKIKTPAISYDLKLFINDEKIKTELYNKSPITLQIRKDEMPSSLLVRGIRIYAVNDSEDFDPVPLLLPIGSNPAIVNIAPGEKVTGEINIKGVIINYCQLLEKNPIIVLWTYSAKSEDNILYPSHGALRIKQEDLGCV